MVPETEPFTIVTRPKVKMRPKIIDTFFIALLILYFEFKKNAIINIQFLFNHISKKSKIT